MYDFIVIGSGTSGGIISKNLHESGANVLLAEAGKHLNKNTFPKTEAAYSSQLFWGGGIEFDKQARSGYLRAKMVGGTSIVNQCLLDRFDDSAFDDWKQRSGVNFFSVNAMQPYYEKVEKNTILHTFDKSDCNNNAKLFIDGSQKWNYKWKFLRRGQSDCKIKEGNDCIVCLGGCHRDSKQSTLVTSIQKAEKKGLAILPEFEVRQLLHHNDHVCVKGKHTTGEMELKAKKIILAGGSFGTTKILFNSGFKPYCPALGKGFCQHPQYMSFGIYDQIVDSYKGAFQTVCSHDESFRHKGFKLENVFAPPISIGMLFPSYEKEHQKLMKKFRNFSCIEVAVRDEPEGGELTVAKNGNLIITKNLTIQDKQRRDSGLKTVDNILYSSGAKEIIRSPYFFGLHLMGGCSIGVDEKTSVVSPDFQLHGFKNIYVSDSSIFPSAPGINPSLTIMALSQKLSEKLVINN